MAFLEMRDISKSFFGVPVLRGVNLSLNSGGALGLIGENGAGKSTLMNILGGVVPQDAGTMTLGGEPYAPRGPNEAAARGVAFIHQELNLFPNLTVAENLFVGGFPRDRLGFIRGREMRAKARELLAAVNLDVSPDLTVERLSPGERQLVEIASALGTDARLLIFDEPTTSLTNRETDRLFALIGRLRGEGRGVIYISHILGDVRELCDSLLVLRDGAVVAGGPMGDFTVPRMISAMVGRSLDQLYPPREAAPGSEVVLRARSVSQRGVVEDVSLDVRAGEVVGLFGLMGAGRSELARILFGLDGFERGEIEIAGEVQRKHTPEARVRAGMAFVTENRREEGLLMDHPVLDNLGLASLRRFATGGSLRPAHLGREARGVANALRLRAGRLEAQPVRSLSGGNQQKTVVGKWLLNEPRVFILDEPTRGVDVGAKYEIYTLVNDLAAKGAGILMISSELEELLGMCDRVLVMANGEVRAEFARSEFDRTRILASAFREGVGA
ncbi:sugar ABC transporter ATP-binding protein [Deinococcus planocerae]|uniref:sugar ABC transporter ATP-binding protein n=1 Tax=Deinococcus planocerae TaxID=1737569 RepID=UPI000C7F7577|nr:sugar ABC transporter ATP-binding protein [Deinococcus planocerae]